MPKQCSQDVKNRAVSYVLDRLDRYQSVYAACQDLGPKLNVGGESLRRWVLQAQVDAGDRMGPSSEELAEIKALKSKVRDLEETNEILRQASMFFARELDPRQR
ncbi:MAG: hypothetical protein L0K07_09905 [Yaniella sp.]|uniref:hypothetical protein n=1 Tax=Yaniella sp. TaxID=2773929 RepID=UPI0026495783|nr:hypothetical protein [Yaniella sp.]MDN5731634.1 hypothetical protein [Yaniella sp.]MDN5816281.1 hypothetical protein [Yaniella sp.]MDN5837486.1 hypothetical protein [Yaniella sp.]MDN5889709.1 hypothetical protein [Yaniella sp.]MDN5913126.1 hypothetical protein [Yaniella sp.]